MLYFRSFSESMHRSCVHSRDETLVCCIHLLIVSMQLWESKLWARSSTIFKRLLRLPRTLMLLSDLFYANEIYKRYKHILAVFCLKMRSTDFPLHKVFNTPRASGKAQIVNVNGNFNPLTLCGITD